MGRVPRLAGARRGSPSSRSCRSHDAARELESAARDVLDRRHPRQGENYVAPAVRFRLKNVSAPGHRLGPGARRFPAPDQEEAWGSIQEQVSTWSSRCGLARTGRHRALGGPLPSAADPAEILRSPTFKDPRVEIYVRIGASAWASSPRPRRAADRRSGRGCELAKP